MVVGYNEFADQWADAVDKTLDAFERIGVEHVFWLTMIGHMPYLKMNDELKAAAEKHPKLTVVDWYAYSRNHPDWFQDDGLHLGGVGAQAMATLIRKKLVDGGVAVPPVVVKTKTLPVARRGKSYTARLQAESGRRPYTWSLCRPASAGTPLASVRRRLGSAPRQRPCPAGSRSPSGRRTRSARSTLASSCFASARAPGACSSRQSPSRSSS